MVNEFVARRADGLPALAWIAVIPRQATNLAVWHGSAVEVFSDGFFEGAWDGVLSDGRFDLAVNVFGSGAKISAHGITFVTPSHTLEPLYFVSTDRVTAVSNSLPFVLTYCGLGFDAYNFSYGPSFSAIVNGLSHTPQDLRLQGGRLKIVYHHNVGLDPDGRLSISPKTLPPRFDNYDDYCLCLKTVGNRIFENAADQRRCLRYHPLSTISSGYDSAAVAAVAKSCGCTETVGLAESNAGKPDSGRLVAEALAMEHAEFTRMKRASGSQQVEAEFLASGMQGEDLVYSVFEQRLKGRILTTGFQGGKVWEKSDPLNADIRRGDLSGSSLGEFRLRTNFLHLPMAFIGCQRHADILRISNAPEMAPYSLGGNYDRPIPRRILEEAGVPRSLFAQAKRGASIILFQSHHDRMSTAAHESIARYCKKEGLYPWYPIVLYPKLAWWTIGRNLYRVCRKLRKLSGLNKDSTLSGLISRIGVGLFDIEAPVYGASHPRFTILLMWAVAEIGRRFAAAGAPSNAHPAYDGKRADHSPITPLEGAPIAPGETSGEAPAGYRRG